MPIFITRIKIFIVLLFLMVIDIGPFPFTASLAMMVLLFRPRWFKELVDRIYSNTHFE